MTKQDAYSSSPNWCVHFNLFNTSSFAALITREVKQAIPLEQSGDRNMSKPHDRTLHSEPRKGSPWWTMTVQESWCTHVAHTQAFSSWQATSEVLVLTNLGSPTPDHGMERTAQAGSIPWAQARYRTVTHIQKRNTQNSVTSTKTCCSHEWWRLMPGSKVSQFYLLAIHCKKRACSSQILYC